jgi:hypothetical protein
MRPLSKDPADFAYTPPPARRAALVRTVMWGFRLLMVAAGALEVLRLAGAI